MEKEKVKKTKKEKKEKKEKSKTRIWIENIVEILIVIVCLVFSAITIANPGGLQKDIHKTNVSYMPVLSDSMSGTFEKGDLIFGKKIKVDSDGNCEILDIGEVAMFVVDNVNVSKYLFINTHRIVGYYYDYVGTDDLYHTGYNELLFKEGITNAESASEYATSQGWTNFRITNYITSGDNKSIYYVDGNMDGELLDPSNTNLIDSYKPGVNDVIGTWNGKKWSKVGAIIDWVKTPLNFFLVILIPLILLFGYNIFIMVKYIIDEKTAKARKLALEEAKNSNSITAEEEEEIKRKAVEEYIKKMGLDSNSLPKEEENKDKKE